LQQMPSNKLLQLVNFSGLMVRKCLQE
jgi:hypothetical protein